jgi:archaetidylinositol phosphate synthase
MNDLHQQDVKSHQRVNDILLGPLERPALLWLAARMPAWVTPDILTGVGLLASVLIFVSYWLTNVNKAFLWLACFGFLLNWFGDSLDGNLARFRKIERPRYGYFVDHTVDALSEVLIFLGIGLSPFVRFDLACLALISYLLMSVLVYVTTYVNNVFRVSYGRLGPTEMRLIAILANIVVFFMDNPTIRLPFNLGTGSFYDIVAVVISVLLFGIFAVVAIQQSIELNKQDREGLGARRPIRFKIRRARKSAARRFSATQD